MNVPRLDSWRMAIESRSTRSCFRTRLLTVAIWAAAGMVGGCSPIPEPQERAPSTMSSRAEVEVAACMDPEPPEAYVGPFSTGDGYFRVWTGTSYRKIFIRAVNMGAALPGAGPNDLNATEEMYARWFDLMREGGVNAVRLYTLHFPLFYKTLAAHNLAHPEAPIYLIQGIHLPEPSEGQELDLHLLSTRFRANIEEYVDCIHGARVIAERPRAAYGTYDTDVSSWTLGWLPGREVLAGEVRATDRLHPSETSYLGQRVSMQVATPTEAWVASHLDHLVDYEMSGYGGMSRPFAFSNWLETDPLRHPTEGKGSGMDIAQMDLGRLDPHGAPAGYFVSYHCYPYYPNFVSEDPVYRMFSDDLGPNSYRGILEDLRRHHGKVPLFIAEFGVPSSWGRAHTSYSGMHHGGLDEPSQGLFLARMIRDIYEVGAAGGSVFHLTDGWWKRVWLTNRLTFPSERLRLWHDMMNPQQHYGLIAFQLPAPDFQAAEASVGTGRVREVRAAFDAEFVHLRVDLDGPLGDGQSLVVGLDTYADDRGETLLPDGVRTSLRSEFALTVTAPGTAELKVLRAYDLHAIRFSEPPAGVFFRSIASDAGDWSTMLWQISAPHSSDDGQWVFPAEDHPIGSLVARRATAGASSLDAVVIDGSQVTIRIPWTLLNFTDPSRLQVMDDDLATTTTREVAVTSGIAFAVSADGSLVETPRRGWTSWNKAPATTERVKAGAQIFFERLHRLPTWMD